MFSEPKPTWSACENSIIRDDIWNESMSRMINRIKMLNK